MKFDVLLIKTIYFFSLVLLERSYKKMLFELLSQI